MAQRRAREDRAALRLHPGRPRPLVLHPPQVAPRPCPIRRGGQAALPQDRLRALRPRQPVLPARHSRPKGPVRRVRRLQHHQGQAAALGGPAHGGPWRDRRHPRSNGRPVRPPYLPYRPRRHGGPGLLRHRHICAGGIPRRGPAPRPGVPQQDGPAGHRRVRLLRVAGGGGRPADAQDAGTPRLPVRLAQGPQRHRRHHVRDGHPTRRAPPARRVLHPRLAGADHGARGRDTTRWTSASSTPPAAPGPSSPRPSPTSYEAASNEAYLHPEDVLDRSFAPPLRASTCTRWPCTSPGALGCWPPNPPYRPPSTKASPPTLTVPVYLGDALQLRYRADDMFAEHEVTIPVEDERNTELVFPISLVERARGLRRPNGRRRRGHRERRRPDLRPRRPRH